MANTKTTTNEGVGLPSAAMVVIGLLSAAVVAGSFEIVKVWPLPASVVPYFGWQGGALWGLVVGSISGLVLGFCVDDSHFPDA